MESTPTRATPAPTRRRLAPDALWSAPRRTRLFALDRDARRRRRPTDVVLLVICLLAGSILVQGAAPPSGFEEALIDLARSIPSIFEVVWQVCAGLALLWAAVLVVSSLVRWRIDVLRDQVVAVLVAAAGTAWLLPTLGGTDRSVWEAMWAGGPPTDPLCARLALISAVTVVTSPHLARPFRATSRWLLLLAGTSLVILGATTPSGALLGVLMGTVAAAIAHLVFGSSGGRPSIDQVRHALAELGVEADDLRETAGQRAGVHQLEAVAPGGGDLVVKVYGRDAWDAQLLAKGWRALWYRDAEALTLTRLQQAEHEGFVTLLAARNGVPVHDVVRAGRSSGNDAIIVLHRRGVPLPAAADAATVDALWSCVLALGDAGFAHGDLAPVRFRLDGNEAVVDGLAGASSAPSGDQRRADWAQVLVSVALLAGADAAVESAQRRLGVDQLSEVLPYLQRAAMGPSLRSALANDTTGLDLDDLRSLAAAAAGVEEPKLAKLRRVSASTLIQLGLLVGAAYILISTLSGIDTEELLDALQSASLPILVVALILAQTPRFAQAEATRGACPRPIAYGPVALLQFAITFVNLVVPSTAARVAVNIRFFQRQGIPPASAVSIGVIDSLGGFAVQLMILVSTLVFGFGNVDLDLDRPEDVLDGPLVKILIIAAVLVVVAVVVVLVVPVLRAKLFDRVRPWLHEARETVASLRSPSKVARVLGGNLVSELLFSCTMAVVLAAFGESLPLATILVINVSVSLFAGLMPVPGGIGVSEGALMVGLTAAGIDQATAFAATIAYRLCTYYLPPIWGGVAFHRLERSGQL